MAKNEKELDKELLKQFGKLAKASKLVKRGKGK